MVYGGFMVNPSLTSFSVHAKMGGSRGFKGENSLAGFTVKYSIKKQNRITDT